MHNLMISDDPRYTIIIVQEDRVQKIARKFKFSHGKKIVHIEDQPRYGSKDSLIKASSFESYLIRVGSILAAGAWLLRGRGGTRGGGGSPSCSWWWRTTLSSPRSGTGPPSTSGPRCSTAQYSTVHNTVQHNPSVRRPPTHVGSVPGAPDLHHHQGGQHQEHLQRGQVRGQ